MTGTVFVYGTLQFPEVLRALIGRVPDQEPACLKGFRRYCVKGHTFPAIIPGDADDQVPGLVMYGLNAHEMKVFDWFEDEEYVKTAGNVLLLNKDEELNVLYYVWHPSLHDKLDFRAWDLENFRRHHLTQFEQMCIQFAAQPEGKDPWFQ